MQDHILFEIQVEVNNKTFVKGWHWGFGVLVRRRKAVVMSYFHSWKLPFGTQVVLRGRLLFPPFPPHLKFWWDMKTPSSALPHAENYWVFFCLFCSENKEKQKGYQKPALCDSDQTVYVGQLNTERFLLLSRLVLEDTELLNREEAE